MKKLNYIHYVPLLPLKPPDILHTVHLMHCICRHLDHLEETKPVVMNHFRSAVYGDREDLTVLWGDAEVDDGSTVAF